MIKRVEDWSDQNLPRLERILVRLALFWILRCRPGDAGLASEMSGAN